MATNHGAFELDDDGKHFGKVPDLVDTVNGLLSGEGGLLVAGFHSVKKVSGGRVSTIYSTQSDTFADSNAPDIGPEAY